MTTLLYILNKLDYLETCFIREIYSFFPLFLVGQHSWSSFSVRFSLTSESRHLGILRKDVELLTYNFGPRVFDQVEAQGHNNGPLRSPLSCYWVLSPRLQTTLNSNICMQEHDNKLKAYT